MAFPTVQTVGRGGGVTSGGVYTATMPTGIQSGDRLVAMVGFERVATTISVTTPSGWRLIATDLFTSGGISARLWMADRDADGTEGSTLSITTDADSGASQIYRITGHDAATPTEGATGAGGNNSTPNPPAVTPSWGAADTLWFAVHARRGTTTVSAYPTSYTNGINDTSGTGNPAQVASARRELNASSEDPGAFTLSGTARNVPGTVAVRPASAPPAGHPAMRRLGLIPGARPVALGAEGVMVI